MLDDIWPTGFCGGRPGVWNSLPPALREPTLSFNFPEGIENCFVQIAATDL